MRCSRGTFVFCPKKRSVEVQYNNLELGSVFDVLQPSFIPSNQDIKINISPGKKKQRLWRLVDHFFLEGLSPVPAWKAPNEPT